MITRNTTYNAKILLFGEYSILLGSSALSIPFNHFSCSFSFINHNKNNNLVAADCSRRYLIDYLFFLQKSEYFSEIIDLENFNKDINERLYLKSTIPKSYGLGSSGAVVAAVYSRYSLDKNSEGIQSTEEMDKLCKLFSSMESFFHGKSSGIDPLTIYINKPLLFNKQRKLSVVEFKQKTDFSTYLIDTGESAKTNPLISVFMNQFAPDGKINDTAFEYIRLTDKCIQHLLSNNYNDFLNSLRALSYFQLINMYNLIPQNMYQVWKEGLESESIFMKLCGSGGGGYLIAFASDNNKALKFIKNNNLRYIPVNISDSNTNN